MEGSFPEEMCSTYRETRATETGDFPWRGGNEPKSIKELGGISAYTALIDVPIGPAGPFIAD